ncbi:MAG: hypothetical protein SVO26_06160 [Chloroflexota bacterium]|nr:hypothetical protein [Chloroflexota bacterium]
MKRKSIAILSIVVTSVTLGYHFFLSWLLGFVVCKYLSSKTEGEPSKVVSIIIPVGRWRLHLHHWICSLGFIGLSTTTDIYFLSPAVTYGLLGGLVFQGIYCYNDWYRIIRSRERVPVIEHV